MAPVTKVALALLLTGSEAILSRRDDTEDLSCICMNWADVYQESKGHNVTCGQGMELFFALDQMHVGLDSDVRNKLSLAKSSASASAALEKLKKTGVYTEFCTNFFMKAKFNYCVNKRFQMTQEDFHQSKGSWCYVSNKCKLPSATPVPYTNVAAKRCSHLDESLSHLLVEDAAKLADQQHLDQGLIAGHAYIHKDMLVSEVTEPLLEEIKNSQEEKDGVLIWSMRDHFARRWVVRKGAIYEHTLNTTKRGWDVKCIRDCHA